MKALLINSELKTVTPVDYSGGYTTIYKHIGCDLFDVVYAKVGKHRVSIFVDDEGLLKKPQHFFMLPGMDQPIAGNGLVLGEADEQGETMALPEAVDSIPGISFLDIHEVFRLYAQAEEN